MKRKIFDMAKGVGLIPERRKILEIGRLYTYVKKEIIREMNKMNLTKYSEIAAIKTRKRIARILDLANKKVYQWAADAVPAAYGEAKRKADVSLDILGLKPDPAFNPRQHTGSMNDSINLVMDYMVKANASMKQITNQYLYLMKTASAGMAQLQEFEGWEEEAEQWIRDEILDGVETGASRQVVAGQIRTYLMDQLDEDGLINVKGRRYQPRYYAEMVARTEMRKAQSNAIVNSCGEYGTDLVEVSDHGTTTPICMPYEGNIFSISGNSPDFPYLDIRPPFHPNCQHFLYPTSPEALGLEPFQRYREGIGS
jgi:hypothetical protein